MFLASRRTVTAVWTALLALALFGCSSDVSSDSGGGGDGGAPVDPQDSAGADSGTSDRAVYGVGDTFAVSNIGEFEAEYLGLADLGMADGGSVGEVHCYAVLAEISLITAPETGGGGWIPSSESVFDADGADVGTDVTAGCPVSPLLDNGYPPAESVDWVEGVAQKASLAMAAVPVGSEDAMAAIELSSRHGFRLAAEVTETF